jgi:hypothetical protein
VALSITFFCLISIAVLNLFWVNDSFLVGFSIYLLKEISSSSELSMWITLMFGPILSIFFCLSQTTYIVPLLSFLTFLGFSSISPSKFLSCGVFSSSYAYFTYFSSEMGMNDASS